MPTRHPEQGLYQPPFPLLFKSPFLLVRFVLFSLLIYMSLTALVFAAWNVGAGRAFGADVGGASAFLLFNGIAIPFFIAMALAGAKISTLFSFTSSVGFECAWTGIFTLLQIAASIFVTLSGPPEFCDGKAPLSLCASFTVLVPISWLAATLLLGYFVAILALCVAHRRLHRKLWLKSIYDLAWFDDGQDKNSSAPQLPPLNTSPIHFSITPPLSQSQSQNDDGYDVENRLPVAADREKPLPSSPNVWWGRMIPGRAGRDHPFAIRRPGERPRDHYYPSPNSPNNIIYHQSSTISGGSGSGGGPSVVVPPAVAPTTFPYSRPRQHVIHESVPRALGTVPEEFGGASAAVAVNEDEPIPVGDRSQWVRAPRAPGPYMPPPTRPLRAGTRRK